MCTGIAISVSELPVELVKRHRLAERVYARAGKEEFRFLWLDMPTLLPVRWDGRFDLLPWGCKLRRGPLSYGGWVTEERIADGELGRAEEAVIPANFGYQKGTWFLISEGIKGVVVHGRGGPVVYMLTRRASNYYRNMTEQSPTMPVFVNQVI